jgi:ankyrin repeat protein
MELLVDELGANIHLRTNKRRMTPLMVAVERGVLSVVEFLLERGAKVNVRDSRKKQALDYAILSFRYRIQSDVVRVLMKHGAKRGDYHDPGEESPWLHDAYKNISAMLILTTPLVAPRFARPTWLHVDCLRLLFSFLQDNT